MTRQPDGSYTHSGVHIWQCEYAILPRRNRSKGWYISARGHGFLFDTLAAAKAHIDKQKGD